MVCNYIRAIWKYIGHLDSCELSEDSDSSEQEHICRQDFAITKQIFFYQQ